MTIQEKNKLFQEASPEQKRIMIAEDVINLVRMNILLPQKGSFYNLVDERGAGSIQEWICEKRGKCRVCAKGALFFSLVEKVNECDFNTLNYENIGNDFDNIPHRKLLAYFSPHQLDLIEIAFEGYSYLHTGVDGTDVAKYVSISDPSLRMIAIMENIIKNNGTFKPNLDTGEVLDLQDKF